MNKSLTGIVFAAALIMFCVTNPVLAAPSGYTCKILSGLSVSSGKMKETGFSKGFLSVQYLYFDFGAGKLSWGRPPGIVTAVARYKVWQKGTKGSDMVALPDNAGTPSFREFLKISVGEKTMPFVYLREMNVFSGTCTIH